MSCSAHAVVVADDPAPLLDLVDQRLVQLERRWSRFLADSEVSGLNSAGGSPRRCSADTVALVEAMVRGWHATEGAFDPTMLGALVELGYAASRSDESARTSLAGEVRPVGRPDLMLVDPATGVVQLPPGTAIDAGGIGKGLAADLIVEELLDAGADGALVEIGGDLRVAGRSPEGRGWPIGIGSTPDTGPETIELAEGGVATSSSRLRTWGSGSRHHLLDPRTLQPTPATGHGDDVVECTVVAGTATWAEVFTKVAFVEGRASATTAYDRIGLAARITTEDGRTHHSDAWQGFHR